MTKDAWITKARELLNASATGPGRVVSLFLRSDINALLSAHPVCSWCGAVIAPSVIDARKRKARP
jgi:hypothetical protein